MTAPVSSSNSFGPFVSRHLGPREADVAAMLDLAESTFGRIDVLHNNAGANRTDDLDVVSTSLDTWRLALEVDLLGVVAGIKNAIPRMVATGGGSIVNTASAGPFHGDTSLVAYAAAKAGVLSLTRYVATSHGRAGIRCNAVAPGLVLTSGAREHFPVPALLDAISRHQPLAGFTSPDDVADLVVFLASDESRFVTGQTFVIDAGATTMASTVPRINEVLGQPTG